MSIAMELANANKLLEYCRTAGSDEGSLCITEMSTGHLSGSQKVGCMGIQIQSAVCREKRTVADP